ncbi:zinc transporter, ZIP family [Cnuella takakiae]|uniref:Zinc transporter, ZIP family n=1 Tax=Cnuella takakiae TaxID=1302690 RepID=A0A1M5HTH1_9BACT|nr:hypothetical protein [Cnuella takakiae]OLY95666.1 hypothetical protein BUE76_00140 [Cnuella takakiae]SHG19172.1 zinc transporter, ZIP family [Cnuella takakiae]
MVLKILLFSLLPAIVLISTGMIAAYKSPSENLRGAILHFAAGVVFSIVAVELLPGIIEKHLPLEVLLGFGSGIGLMFLIEKLTKQNLSVKGTLEGEAARGFLITMGVDIVIDGLLLGIGFAAGEEQGILLAVALTIEIMALALALAAQLTADGYTKQRITKLLLLFGGLFLVVAIAGATLFGNLSDELLETLLSFGLAALLYLVTEELLVEAHELKEKSYMTLSFFVGFILFVIIGMYV